MLKVPETPPSPAGRADRFWTGDLAGVLQAPGSGIGGLSADEAARRLARDGPNLVEFPGGHRRLRLLLTQFTSPIVGILIVVTVLSMVWETSPTG